MKRTKTWNLWPQNIFVQSWCVIVNKFTQLRKQVYFQIPSAHSVFNGTEEIKLLGPKIWELLPEIKQFETGFRKHEEKTSKFKPAFRFWREKSGKESLFWGKLGKTFLLVNISQYVNNLSVLHAYISKSCFMNTLLLSVHSLYLFLVL